jgi:hypothetical protein
MNQQQSNLELLQTEWELLRVALDTLQLSVSKCQAIGKKSHYSVHLHDNALTCYSFLLQRNWLPKSL